MASVTFKYDGTPLSTSGKNSLLGWWIIALLEICGVNVSHPDDLEDTEVDYEQWATPDITIVYDGDPQSFDPEDHSEMILKLKDGVLICDDEADVTPLKNIEARWTA